MSKKTIAVDVDDVLAAHVEGFVAFSNKKWGTDLKPSDYDDHWARLWGCDNAEVKKRFDALYTSGLFKTLREFDQAKPVLQELARTHKLVILTSRRKELIPDTDEWINMYFEGIFEEIHYAGMWDTIREDSHLVTKAEISRQIGADYLIDDQLKHCIGAAKTGLETLLFGDYGWNQQDELPANVTRVKGWVEVKEFFDGRS